MSSPAGLIRRPTVAVTLATCVLALAPSLASAHARVSPAVSLSGELQLYSLAGPTEKNNLRTTEVVMTVPSNFSIDSFVPPPPGWHLHYSQTGSGDSAIVTQANWTGGDTPTGEDSLFQFLAEPANPGSYTFHVQQTYSDGSIVNWTDPETGADPAPTIQAVGSLAGGGGGTSTLTIVALVVGVLGLVAGGFALVSGGGGIGGAGGRPLA